VDHPDHRVRMDQLVQQEIPAILVHQARKSDHQASLDQVDNRVHRGHLGLQETRDRREIKDKVVAQDPPDHLGQADRRVKTVSLDLPGHQEMPDHRVDQVHRDHPVDPGLRESVNPELPGLLDSPDFKALLDPMEIKELQAPKETMEFRVRQELLDRLDQ